MLALVGSGEYLPPMEPVDRYLLGQLIGEPRVVCLPTAAGSEGTARINYWLELGEKHFSGLGVRVESLPVIDAASANNPELVEKIRQANFVYLSGGKPNYLYLTMADSLAWAGIMEVYQKDGVLAGCSAGAMIMGESIPGIPRLKPAFSLLKGAVIMPHFDELPSMMTNTLHMLVRSEHTLLGIEGNTALVGRGESYQVAGSGGVVVWSKKGKVRYTNGQAVHWM